MVSAIARQPIGQLVAEHPSRANVFERFGIDYCCYGGLFLAEACAERKLNLQKIVQALDADDKIRLPPRVDDVDWRAESLTALVDHIQARHHSYLRAQLPRLGLLMDKVPSAHRQRLPELGLLQRIFSAFVDNVVPHMLKEEFVVFPAIRRREESEGRGATAATELRKSIELMEDEHEIMGAQLRAMRDLTDAIQPPAEACRSWRALFVGLADLEADMHLHLHKENNILFFRVRGNP
jgi:regulator of cell morphogenesis and NO signaling